MDLFTYDANTHNVEISKADVFLIKEFKELFEKEGIQRLKYLYLVYDWKSPYSELSELERKEAAKSDTGLKEVDLISETLQIAIKKYQSIQETRTLKLLNSAYSAIDKLRIYFEVVDPTEIDPMTGKPVYAAKNIISEIANLDKLVKGLDALRETVKSEQQQITGLKGNRKKGMFD